MNETHSHADDETMRALTERARVISQEASLKVGSALREMIGSAAGLAGFAVESARDIVQYMVRRGQMTQEEADRLIREAEATHMKKPKAERDRIAAARAAVDKAAAEKKAAMLAAENARPVHRPPAPGRLLALGAGKAVKTPPVAKVAGAPASEPAARTGPAAKSSPAAKAAPAAKTAPAPKAASTKSAASKAEPARPAAKAAKAATKKVAPVKAAPKKSAAKPAAKVSKKAAPAKKAVKKKR